MDPNTTTPETIETLALELDDVEWFGRSTIEATPAGVGTLDLLLFMMGGALDDEQLRPTG